MEVLKQDGILLEGHFRKYAIIELNIEDENKFPRLLSRETDAKYTNEEYAYLTYHKCASSIPTWTNQECLEDNPENNPYFYVIYYYHPREFHLGYEKYNHSKGLDSIKSVVFKDNADGPDNKRIRIVLPYHPSKVELRSTYGIGYINKNNQLVLNSEGAPSYIKAIKKAIPFVDSQKNPIQFNIVKILNYSK